jgi:hypothetical protein
VFSHASRANGVGSQPLVGRHYQSVPSRCLSGLGGEGGHLILNHDNDNNDDEDNKGDMDNKDDRDDKNQQG